MILYHRHINDRMDKVCKKLAEMMGLTLHIDYSDRHVGCQMHLFEIANSAIKWSIENGYNPSLAIGCYSNSSILCNNFFRYGADTREMWRAFEKIWAATIEDFYVKMIFPSIEEMWYFMLSHKTYLDIADSPDYSYFYILKTDFGLIEGSDTYYMKCFMKLWREWNDMMREPIYDAEEFFKKRFFHSIYRSKYRKTVLQKSVSST